MSKYRSWWIPVCIGAISACSDDEHHGSKQDAFLVVHTAGCAGEEGVLFVDGDAVFNGALADLEGASLQVAPGKHRIALWIGKENPYDQQVDVAGGQIVTVDAPRSVECPDASTETGSDGGSTDGGVDAGPVTLLEPCSADDNSMDAAQRIVAGSIDDALCGSGDVDFFELAVGDETVTKVTLSIEGLESALSGELTLYDEHGSQLDVQTDDGEDAVVHFSLLGGQHYFVRVADLSGAEDPDGGVAMNPYKLSLAFAADTATVEASAGTFHGATNNQDDTAPAELEGSYVATSVHTADNQPVAYKLLGSVALPGAEAQRFVYDPSDLADGVLRIVFYDGVEPVSKARKLGARDFARWNDWVVRPLVRNHGLQLLDALAGDVVITFPSQQFTRTVSAAALLDVPTVTAATPSGDPTTLAVTVTAVAGATKYAASAFGNGDAAAHGAATSTSASFDIALDAKLEADETFTLRVRATDDAFIELPLPETSNVSEYIYYSDESARQLERRP
jgi:hypothetical protein